MKTVKKAVSVLLAAVLTLGCVLFASAEGPDDFVPVLRFVAASDTHIRENEVSNVERIHKMMELAYGVSEADPYYHAVDALLMVKSGV